MMTSSNTWICIEGQYSLLLIFDTGKDTLRAIYYSFYLDTTEVGKGPFIQGFNENLRLRNIEILNFSLFSVMFLFSLQRSKIRGD